MSNISVPATKRPFCKNRNLFNLVFKVGFARRGLVRAKTFPQTSNKKTLWTLIKSSECGTRSFVKHFLTKLTGIYACLRHDGNQSFLQALHQLPLRGLIYYFKTLVKIWENMVGNPNFCKKILSTLGTAAFWRTVIFSGDLNVCLFWGLVTKTTGGHKT